MSKHKRNKSQQRAAASDALSQQQTVARTAQSTALNYNSVSTLDPARLAAAFSAADMGFISDQASLFEMIEERDPHIYAELNKRRLAVTGLKWQLEPPRDASQPELDAMLELEDMIASIPGIEDVQFDMTDAIGKGIVAMEIDWATGETWLPNKVSFVPQRNFKSDIDSGELRYLHRGIPEPLLEYKWLTHEHRAKSGYMEQTALFRVLAWTYAYKAYTTKDRMRFLEVYGLPLRLGKYPAGLGDKQRNELLRAVRSIGNDGAGVIASNMAIEFIQANAGKVDDFLQDTAYWEAKQSKAILGGELDGKTTSEARIMMYDKVRREILLHDVKQLEPSYTHGLIKPIALLNGMLTADRLPKWRYITDDPADRKALIDVISTAVSLNMQISVDWAHKELQIPIPKEGDAVLGAVPEKMPPAALRAALSAAPLANQPSIADAYSLQLSNAMLPHEAAQIGRIAALVSEAGDFEGAMAALTDFNLQKSDAQAVNTLAEGMMAANLAGRTESK
jgi:phage gp29-like protein